MGWLDDCPTRFADGICLFIYFIHLFSGPHVDTPLTAKQEKEHESEYLLTETSKNNHWVEK